jgi:phosphate starvation-inducible PhoH-like protein
MTDATITLSDPQEVLLLFGSQDRFLRKIRDAVGLDVTYRGDEIRLHGTDDQIKRGLQVFAEMRGIMEKNGEVSEDELAGILVQTNGHKPPNVLVPVAADEVLPRLDKVKRVAPRTRGQVEYVQSVQDNELVFCVGPAGSGKTYLAVAMAVNALRLEQVKKIVLVRPAVEAGEKLGFLPGDLLAKVNPFLRPLLDALNEMLDYEQVKRYMERDVIEIVPLAFMRGRTLNQTFIILDEAQNTTVTQMKMFLTRMGQGSRIVVTGDTTQSDLPPAVSSGLVDAIRRLEHIEGVGTVHLTGRDIVRHRLVKEIVKAYDDDATGHLHRRKKG